MHLEGEKAAAIKRAVTMFRKTRTPNRRGYAIVMVCAFVVLFLGMIGVAWREVAALLRLEKALVIQQRCDEGSVRVLGLAMQVLETRLRKDTSDAVASIEISAGTFRPDSGDTFHCKKYSSDTDQWYDVTFTRTESDGSKWNVSVAAATEADVAAYPDLPSNPP